MVTFFFLVILGPVQQADSGCLFALFNLMPQFAAQRRSIFTNFPIPFEHPYTVPVLIAALSTSSLIYYYLSASHDAELRDAQRRRDLQKRKSMKRPEDRFASMKVSLVTL
jgi:N-acyl-phosphatidylethanolamine-hydrolysing phospholipase D